MKHDDLFLLQYIFSSDDDFNPVEDIYVGYDESFNLILLLEHTDHDFPLFNCHTYALIKKEDAFSLARKLSIPMTELPTVISNAPDDSYYEIINPTLNEVRDCFKDIIDCFTDEKCRFQIVRKYGKYGYHCI